MNVVCIDGRLGRDPELRYTPTGKAVCNFSIANDIGYGENRTTHWFNIFAWNGQAEAVCQHLIKGNHVAVTGNLVVRDWEDRDGNKRKTTEIVARSVDFLSPKNSGASEPKPQGEEPTFPEESEIPF